MIYTFIENATKEFEQHGRSKRFIAMEDKIIKTGNPLQAYYFARYARGADVTRLQPVLIENAPMDVCWYFQLYVPNADIEAFIKKAVYDGNNFWINKFVKLKGKIQKKNKLNKDVKEAQNEADEEKASKNDKKVVQRRKAEIKQIDSIKLDAIIDKANREYALNGASRTFLDYEREVVYSDGLGGNQALYLKSVEGANIKAFERAALLRGAAFHMYLLAKEFGADTKLMLQGIRLAKLDYCEIDKDKQSMKAGVDSLNSQIEDAVKQGDMLLANRLKEQLRKREAGWCYLDHVKMYEAEVAGMVLDEIER